MRRSASTGALAGERLVRALYQTHGAAIMAYANRLTGDSRLAEDVFQETLVRAWRNSEALATSTGAVRTWLFATCRGIVIEQARHHDVRPPRLPDANGLPQDLHCTTSSAGHG